MKLVIFIMIMLTFFNTALTQESEHPLIAPFKGSFIELKEIKEFDEQLFVIGKVQPDQSVKTIKVEGKVTKLDYRDPDNRSSLERIKNYEMALKKAGFEIIFSCAQEECGPEIQVATIGFYPQERNLVASLKRKEGSVVVSVLVSSGPWTKIRVVEEKPMEADMVQVTADVLKKNILKEGHMAVYGILFDTNKSELKPASAQTIKEIANLLQNEPTLKLYIVGHTDNEGNLKDNLELSRKRAISVIAELVAHHKIDAARLEAGGVGPLAPVASNDTKEGKDLNRRVEIVKK